MPILLFILKKINILNFNISKKFQTWYCFVIKGPLYVEERKHISTYNHFVKHKMILVKGVMEADE